MDETARGIGGIAARGWRTLVLAGVVVRFVAFYLTKGREVRLRHRRAEQTGATIWLDHGPFGNEAER